MDGWLQSLGEQEDIADIRQHPTRDDWWESNNSAQDFAEVNTTAVHIGGWYDIFAQHTIDAFLGYQNQSQQAGNQILIMGPWTHAVNAAEIGELFIENAPFERYEELLFLWLNACLIDDNPALLRDEMPPVTYFTIGAVGEEDAPGNTWHTAETWPPAGGVDTALYLGANNSLSDTTSNTEGGDTFTYDPNNPTATICGANLILPAGSCDQREIESRGDVLIYETDILDAPLEVTGDIRAQIWIETDVPDTDIVVRITDVYPDGRSMLVVDGIMRARYHASLDFSTETLLVPGEPILLEFEIAPTSYIFNDGHRLRVSITSSNAPRFAPNPNTGAMFFNPGDETRIASTRLLWGDTHPSAIVLPVHD
ncbi:CocE/NonD family hydrolase [bacterium]|nr:CocE/NonD family hydrolase [bacterium]